MNYKLGCLKDLPDHRDFKYPLATIAHYPPVVDLRSEMPPVYDQGSLGSCTGNAIAGAIHWELIKEKLQPFVPSRLFIYYNERKIEGTVSLDNGACIRNGMKSISTTGYCDEFVWPYHISRYREEPSSGAFAQAKQIHHRTRQYKRLNGLLDVKNALAQRNIVVFGFMVFENFYETKDVMPMPGPDDRPEGGHAVAVAGYDDTHQHVIIRNSWGSDWGVDGYFYMPYKFFQHPHYVFDMWTIERV